VERLEVAAAVSLTFRGRRAERAASATPGCGCRRRSLKAVLLWRHLGETLTDAEKHGDVEDRPAF
jgi:hypothetical protein